MGFETCHPAVNAIFFAAVISAGLSFSHPVFLIIGFCAAFAYSCRRGMRALWQNLCLLPCAVVFALCYAGTHHFGITVLRQNFIGNRLTVESLVYGLVLGLQLATAGMWLRCLYAVFTADKVVYLLGQVSPGLSLFVSILLRMVPRIGAQTRRLHTARQGIGRGCGKNAAGGRLKNALRIFSMMISWTIGALVTASESMQSRGSSLRGRRAFSIYRFDGRDRAFVIVLFTCLTLTVMGALLGTTRMVCDPQIIVPPITAVQLPLCIGYGLLCLLPLLLELGTELSFVRSAAHALDHAKP